ncbi:RluA family pseudouridine synthase, partial [Methylobacterium goesingense]
MTTRPPSRGGAGRRGPGRPSSQGKFSGKPGRPGKPGAFKRPDRERTGPRTSALDAAQRAAVNRGEAGKPAPWRPGQQPRDREEGEHEAFEAVTEAAPRP